MDAVLTDVQTEVWTVIRQFNDAFAANDPETYFTFIDPNITVIIPGCPYRIDGIEHDREEFEFSLRRGATRVGYFQELQPNIAVYGDTAIVIYYSRGSYGMDDAVRTLYLKETDVLVRHDASWKIVHIHVSA